MFRKVESIIGLWLFFNFAFSSAYPFEEKFKLDQDETNRDFQTGELFFEQKLDHFDLNNSETWQQRYWCIPHKQSNGAVLLFIHDPHTVSEVDVIDEKFLKPLAETLNATRFYLEHRFYGKSRPKNDTNMTSLSYLNVEQALADIANFIEKITKQHGFPADNEIKWVVIGLSYGGTLATWARYKYPKLITSAVAVNAPLLAKVDFAEYYQNVVNSLNSFNRRCAERVALANEELKLSIASAESRQSISKMFQLCDNVTENPDEVSNLFVELANNFAYVVDFTEMSTKPRKNVAVQKLCDIMLNSAVSPLQSYAEVNKLNLRDRLNPEKKCFDYRNDNMVEELKKINYDDNAEISRQWKYQLCTEFGFFASSSGASEIFGDNFPVTYFAKKCQQIFGAEFNMAYIEEKVSSINKEFSGLKINVTQTIFMYYPEDPWRTLFVTKSKPDYYEVIEIRGNHYARNAMELNNQYGGLSELVDSLSAAVPEISKYVICKLSGGDGCVQFEEISVFKE